MLLAITRFTKHNTAIEGRGRGGGLNSLRIDGFGLFGLMKAYGLRTFATNRTDSGISKIRRITDQPTIYSRILDSACAEVRGSQPKLGSRFECFGYFVLYWDSPFLNSSPRFMALYGCFQAMTEIILNDNHQNKHPNKVRCSGNYTAKFSGNANSNLNE